jgi:lysozyme
MQSRNKRLSVAAAIAAAIAIPAEGLRQVAYYDPPGILTVCYGSTTNVERGKRYSLEECKARLDADMMEAIASVDRCAPNLPENVLAAFGDAAYNLGPTIACGPSTASKYLKAGDLTAACNQLPRWNKARVAGVLVELPGLTKRRNAERDLCLKGIS